MTLISFHWAYQSGTGLSFEALPGTAMESFKIADAAGLNPRRLTKAMYGVVVLALLIFGPKKLPDLGSSLGRSITGFKKGLKETKDDVQSAIKEDVTADPPSTTETPATAAAAPATTTTTATAAAEAPAADTAAKTETTEQG